MIPYKHFVNNKIIDVIEHRIVKPTSKTRLLKIIDGNERVKSAGNNVKRKVGDVRFVVKMAFVVEEKDIQPGIEVVPFKAFWWLVDMNMTVSHQ